MEASIATENHTKNAGNWSLALGVLIVLVGIFALFALTLTTLATKSCASVAMARR